MNAKVGEDLMIPNVGKFGLHNVSSDTGTRLADFSVTRNLVISSTMFPHKKIHKETWISPDGLTRNQIDHVMIDARHASNIIDVRSYRGADCDSDHFIVKIKYKQR
jgi:endonuclease/exonuclease/phosphatase family metal-dependent hydrolase